MLTWFEFVSVGCFLLTCLFWKEFWNMRVQLKCLEDEGDDKDAQLAESQHTIVEMHFNAVLDSLQMLGQVMHVTLSRESALFDLEAERQAIEKIARKITVSNSCEDDATDANIASQKSGRMISGRTS
jgi:hypothetical protein